MNLNLNLVFDSENKFLLCGELVKFNLKITSPDFTVPSSFEINEFMKRIGANVEVVEIQVDSVGAASLLSSNSSIDSIKGKKMKSAESLSNLLRANELKSHSSSNGSVCSMTSVTAKRFSSLRTSQAEAIWNSEDEAILIPLEIFIDPEGLPTNCNKATAKIKVSLNELVPIAHFDNTEDLLSSHKLERIGQTEISLLVLRPLEVSLRTHNISSTRALLQINSEFNCCCGEDESDGVVPLTIENVQIILSDSFTSRANWNRFKITPIAATQVPFTFELSPQQHSLLFDWKSDHRTDFAADFSGEDFHVRVEFQGKLKKKSLMSEVSLSFESSIPMFTIFPPVQSKGIQITSVKVLHSKLFVLEPFQIEMILHNFDEEMKSINLEVDASAGNQSDLDSKAPFKNPVQEWYRLDEDKKCPSLLLLHPLKGVRIENIPSNGSKAVRLKFVPMRRGVINLIEEFRFRDILESKILKIEPIILQIE